MTRFIPSRLLRRRAWHATAALLWACVLAVGSLDLHSVSGQHDGHDGIGSTGGEFFPAAAHPFQAHHVEAAQAEERPICAACLHSLQTAGQRLSATGSPLLPPSRPLVRGAIVERTLVQALAPSGGRAPPSTLS